MAVHLKFEHIVYKTVYRRNETVANKNTTLEACIPPLERL